MSIIETLPLELHYRIAWFLPISSVSALACSSRHLHRNLTPELYRLAGSSVYYSNYFLYCCIQKRDVHSLQRLLSEGADPVAAVFCLYVPSECLEIPIDSPGFHQYLDSVVEIGSTLLHVAVETGDAVMTSVLLRNGLEKGLGPNFWEGNGETCFEVAAADPQKTTVLRALLETFSTANESDFRGFTFFDPRSFAFVAQKGCAENLELMLEYRRRSDVGIMEEGLNYALDRAFHIRTRDADCAHIIRLLLKHGADGNRALGRRLPLIEAARFGLVEVVRVLIENGMDVNVVHHHMWRRKETPLLEAVKMASLQTGEFYQDLMIDQQFGLETINEDEFNNWIVGKSQAAENIAKMLVESGADLESAMSLLDDDCTANLSNEGKEACRRFISNISMSMRGGGGGGGGGKTSFT